MFEIKGTAEKCREVPKVGREKKMATFPGLVNKKLAIALKNDLYKYSLILLHLFFQKKFTRS